MRHYLLPLPVFVVFVAYLYAGTTPAAPVPAAQSSTTSATPRVLKAVGRLSSTSAAPADMLYRYVDNEHGVVCYIKGGAESSPSCVK